jgi:hypothetical protein
MNAIIWSMPKNLHAVALGRLGGRKGGKARASALSPERRREIAQKAIMTRWEPCRKVLLRIRSSTTRVERYQEAKSLAERIGSDPSDVEHILFNLTLPPLERLARSFQRAKIKNFAIY